jgi:hypothetical protein
MKNHFCVDLMEMENSNNFISIIKRTKTGNLEKKREMRKKEKTKNFRF